jgi:HTH-type transcriptional regulator/antitoxin MqsA
MSVKKQTTPRKCQECGGEMHFKTKTNAVKYLDHERKVRSLGWWCAKCGQGILDMPALLAREKVFLELKADVDGVLGPAEVAKARARLGLSQRKASALLGGGPNAFQKYESGTQAVSVPMSRLLTLLANDPKRLRELPVPKAPGSRRRSVAA